MISGIGGNNSTSPASALSKAVGNDKFVSQNTFLKLLITQLKNQDPMNPQDSSQFVAELAQFSSLEQMTQLSKSMQTVLESSITNLLGRKVTVADPTTTSGFLEGTVSGVVYYADGPAVTVNGKDYPLAQIQNVKVE
jgi:flagellar basal-body rod modification protein FlgD